VEEYSEPVEEISEPSPEPVKSAPRKYASNTRASYGSAAHALGFSLSDDFFDGMNTGQPEEPDVFEEPVHEETQPVYEENQPVYEETVFEQPVNVGEAGSPVLSDQMMTAEEPAQDVLEYMQPEEPAELSYHESYESGIDEFSFGEGMPDLSLFEDSTPVQEAAESVPVYEPSPEPEPAPEPAVVKKQVKKVIKKKVVKRVVKKPVPNENELPSMDFRDDLSSIKEELAANKEYVDKSSIYDEPEGGEMTQGEYIIEI
jgi:hypothetical protein